MTVRTRNQLVVLGALVAVLVTLTIVRSRGEAPAGVAAPGRQPDATGQRAAEPPVVDVRLELLKASAEGMTPPERNLFQFGARRVAGGSASGTFQAPPDETFEPVPSGPPPIPPIPLKFIGVVERSSWSGRVAILSDARGNVFYGREGDIIDGRYKVLRIGPESAELSYVDGQGRQTLRLSGQ